MITPINNYQSNLSFNASLKPPKLKSGVTRMVEKSNITSKIKNFGNKVKNEFKNMDEESAKYLFDSVVLLTVLTTVFFVVKNYVDKFLALFE